MRVTVVGTGYVGLVTGACLAYLGHQVNCMDRDREKIRQLQEGDLPIYEPGLGALVAEQVAAGRLRFQDEYGEAIPGAEAIFICVGTPPLPDGRADTSAVETVARCLGGHLGPDYCVIVNKSTVPIGSGAWVGMLVRQGCRQRVGAVAEPTLVGSGSGTSRSGGDVTALTAPCVPAFDVVSNPEFLREGTAIDDALSPDRIVIGVESERAEARMRALYEPLRARNAAMGREVPFIVTDRASAELTKYAANAFLATKISFINEIAGICERVGADVQEVAHALGLDRRIGAAFLGAGIGWGGSCFPKDLASLEQTAREYGDELRLLAAVQAVNNAQRLVLVRKLQERLKVIKGTTVALWGLAFKPGTDDVRDAPALTIAQRLTEMGAAVRAYDPRATETARRQGVHAELFTDPYEAACEADALLLVTDWPEFAAADWPRLLQVMRRPLIVDGRNALDRAVLLWHGFEYCGIGR
jgi:UDPglucose 6-dehydrogenase